VDVSVEQSSEVGGGTVNWEKLHHSDATPVKIFGTFFSVKLVGLIYAHIALVPYLFLTTQIINSTECETYLLSNNALDLLYSAHCNNLF